MIRYFSAIRASFLGKAINKEYLASLRVITLLNRGIAKSFPTPTTLRMYQIVKLSSFIRGIFAVIKVKIIYRMFWVVSLLVKKLVRLGTKKRYCYL